MWPSVSRKPTFCLGKLVYHLQSWFRNQATSFFQSWPFDSATPLKRSLKNHPKRSLKKVTENLEEWETLCLQDFLFGGWATHLKNMIVKIGSSFPNFRGENNKYLKPPPRFLNYTYHVYIYIDRDLPTPNLCVFVSHFCCSKGDSSQKNPVFSTHFPSRAGVPSKGYKGTTWAGLPGL